MSTANVHDVVRAKHCDQFSINGEENDDAIVVLLVSRGQDDSAKQLPFLAGVLDRLEYRRMTEETFQIAALYGLWEPTMPWRVPLGGPSGTTKV